MDNTYVESMVAHLAQLEHELNELAAIVQSRTFEQYEYRAAERTLQITIGTCISIAKHWCKKINGIASMNAYQAFEDLAKNHLIDDKVKWKQIIGMRNALVHDYLNVDPAIITHLLSAQLHRDLFTFAQKGLATLSDAKMESK